ncbi:DeoR family transcriptional regulator [Kineosporia sp. NBRC 101677]|uniref:helix-turn-helix transcriptional regulator n=1 Tax=Kineosporia sp. NBRC 101677 TaxID=3032197 RepID=UPI0024A331F6|nr:YafY family protein [Kineosporia sp. NBRC 101677]GLY15939.1 DeoR family transcriptional regulator [Kineosporia sp. NBRC 101677]
MPNDRPHSGTASSRAPIEDVGSASGAHVGQGGGQDLRTTERVLTLLGLLQQRQVWTGPELAERLAVTPRTVRRDVDRLRALGYPVQAGPGAGGGYRLGPGQELPPLLLDDEEAIATAVALLAGAGWIGGPSSTAQANPDATDATLRALSKLDQVLPARLRQEVRALSEAVESFGGGRTPLDPEALLTLARACRDQVEAGFGYRTGAPEPVSQQRRVEPYRLVASDRRWYLFAFDLDRDDWRTFRLDRMSEVHARTWRFTPRPAPDAARYVQEAVTTRVYPQQARFRVHSPATVVRNQIPPSTAAVVEIDASSCEVSSGAAHLDTVLAHVLLLGHAFEVLEPPGLADRARELGHRLLGAAGPQPRKAGPAPG